MQFAAREHHYREHYEGTTFDVVLEGGTAVGLLYVARWRDEIRIVDVAVLPDHRGRGIGSALVGGVLAEAAALGQPVTIHVERFNRALSLYDRLGFTVVEDKGVYLLLERRPRPPAPQAKTAS